MVKFVKDLLKQGKEFGARRKFEVLLKAKSMSKVSLDKIYSIYFWALDGFINNNPTKWQVYGWGIYVVNGIDTQFNKDSQDRAKLILKQFKENKVISEEDRSWIKGELKPYFENSLKIQTGKTIQMLDAVDEGKMTEFLNQVKKEKEGRFK